jgi:hypothetical protein
VHDLNLAGFNACSAAKHLTVALAPGRFVLSGVKRACTYAQSARPGTSKGEQKAQVEVFRDIFGNPFRPISAARIPAPPSVVVLARALYQERRFHEMPILGDALEEAGCTDSDILAHCRQPSAHVRGCWLLETILQKR